MELLIIPVKIIMLLWTPMILDYCNTMHAKCDEVNLTEIKLIRIMKQVVNYSVFTAQHLA